MIDTNNINSWWDVVGTLVITVPAIIAAVASWHNRLDLKTVKNQVQNGHTENFRDEVTDMSTKVGRLSDEIVNLRLDVSTERQERRDSIKELREDLHDRFNNRRDFS